MRPSYAGPSSNYHNGSMIVKPSPADLLAGRTTLRPNPDFSSSLLSTSLQSSSPSPSSSSYASASSLLPSVDQVSQEIKGLIREEMGDMKGRVDIIQAKLETITYLLLQLTSTRPSCNNADNIASSQSPSTQLTPSPCTVCLENVCDTVFCPCGHLCACSGCAEKINQNRNSQEKACPVCRAPISTTIKVYM
eukprot:TRINITY_DN10262_c0_g1_i1.p1 TRINITY_DN10262_c0_g1~~TRINITY_DN10262_c0_g1_i1.p1  ORF type:complete len:192 (-),score=35.59 TRINITY_DN10262_c0_g1_i1:88-663(-)